MVLLQTLQGRNDARRHEWLDVLGRCILTKDIALLTSRTPLLIWPGGDDISAAKLLNV